MTLFTTTTAFSRPFGTRRSDSSNPALKTLGYCQKSLRDESRSMYAAFLELTKKFEALSKCHIELLCIIVIDSASL